MTLLRRGPRSTSRHAGATSASAAALTGAPASQTLFGSDLPSRPRPRRPRAARPPAKLTPELTEVLAAGTLRLVAVDQGSIRCGVALFVGERIAWTKRISATEGWAWGRRMRWITDHLREDLARILEGERPDVVAIEDVVVWRSAQTALAMGETRGWLACVLEHWYPGIRQMAINPASVRGAVEAGARRGAAIDRYGRVAEMLLGARVSEDEAAAIAIGLAARAEMRRAAQLAAAEVIA